ncbi:Phenylalanine aminomutase (L-beta-phenylalanine forming) [Penicillium diatomitis]|uniref:Phenylalanine aminomutase (L-beta-phenylalanine forming) n=1 Tax=Penicillium diatomitis TaxID=2819901 RepID=A0A9W9XBW9_9EURO|nr:Phenylalanine aminomutase (L-beta-phenylalanine forming) [Penicillium diatomitis]KAJ5488466.1 Phenylalanine aminomutase (L-beta-phenylalanine forming) [Penicillium diatomitis]
MLSKSDTRSHLDLASTHLRMLERILQDGKLIVDGDSLTIASVVAISKHSCKPYLTDDQDTLESINNSVSTLEKLLANGHAIYGVNTGFGGSADSRTNHVITLQKSLLQLLQSGILTSKDTGTSNPSKNSTDHESQSMPSEWVKGTILVRANSVSRGHSAVTVAAIESLLMLLREDLTPVVPLRGTISASGDLMPLAYVVGAIEGSPGITVRSGYRTLNAEEALKAIGAKAITLGPKEGLGLVNGTAASAALASLALYEAHQLALLAQINTALAVEAVRGSCESFHPFIAEARPHYGQGEAAANIASLLSGSLLAHSSSRSSIEMSSAKRASKEGLVQDRYSLRTASQWLGPYLEDLLLADYQIGVELNSTSDNPLVDTLNETSYSGGNFQATSVTSAMEKTRLALQMIGKMIFAQCTELIDPSLNNGLPTNLVADNPSLSFTMKGVDINMAAYMSELAYLANPVSSHVQTAEMHNQALNSMAFVSARYTMQAVDIVSMMTAASLYVACQALDLRALQLNFFQALRLSLACSLKDTFNAYLTKVQVEDLCFNVQSACEGAWQVTARQDIQDRCKELVNAILPIIISHFDEQGSDISLHVLNKWKKAAVSEVQEVYMSVFDDFLKNNNTLMFLGNGSQKIYAAIRHELKVPFHLGFIEHPVAEDPTGGKIDGREKKTVGGWISIIYEALRDQRLSGVILAAFGESA